MKKMKIMIPKKNHKTITRIEKHMKQKKHEKCEKLKPLDAQNKA
jgi:hypothetical protein